MRGATLLTHGTADVLDLAVARATAALIPSARLVLLGGAGHLPFWEAPRELFARVESFLDAPILA